MKHILSTLILACALMLACAADAQTYTPHKHYSYQGGHYAGGHGSSHKGGHYKNPRTGNHYTKHQ